MEKKTFIIKEMLPMQSGTSERGNWKSQEIILTEKADVQYPDEVLVRLRNDKLDKMLQSVPPFKVGDEVTIDYASSVRKFTTKDGRMMASQENNCWRIEHVMF